MLRQDVVEAVERGQFRLFPVETIDEGIELLTGMDAGEPGERENSPKESVKDRAQARLAELAEKRHAFLQEWS